MPALRLRGDYLAIVTLGFGEIIRIVILNVDAVGGARGFSLASPAHPGLDLRYEGLGAIYGVVLLSILVIARLVYATGGLAFRAVREDEIAAESIGIATTRVKVEAFLVSSFFAGVAGALFAHSEGYVHTNSFSFLRSIEIVVFVVIGGLGSITRRGARRRDADRGAGGAPWPRRIAHDPLLGAPDRDDDRAAAGPDGAARARGQAGSRSRRGRGGAAMALA